MISTTMPAQKTYGQIRLAVRDIVDGAALWPLWGKLGWNDILQRYRRSLLGPLWLTASMAIMVVALGMLYSQILKIALHDFMPFLCVGLLVWGLISAALTEAGALFTGAESYIKQVRLPYSAYVYRFIWGKIIIFAHNFVIYFGVLIYFKIWPGSTALWAIPGFLLLTLNGALASLYLGIVSARFRDIPQIVASVTQIVFFLTPIMWKPELLRENTALLTFNPFYHLCEVVRAPLLGQLPSVDNYVAVALITAVNFLLAAAFFVRFRARISYWV
ncbi:ABC transporter permease [Streptomyces sp. AcH 505]|uniref:ABC transporter permease n=1 Tax=Streptomyces sp. AcH 505 TaxID=352211 RepID=UPI0019D71208